MCRFLADQEKQVEAFLETWSGSRRWLRAVLPWLVVVTRSTAMLWCRALAEQTATTGCCLTTPVYRSLCWRWLPVSPLLIVLSNLKKKKKNQRGAWDRLEAVSRARVGLERAGFTSCSACAESQRSSQLEQVTAPGCPVPWAIPSAGITHFKGHSWKQSRGQGRGLAIGKEWAPARA